MSDDPAFATGSLLGRATAWVEGYRFTVSMSERGTLVSVGDGIVWVAGLPSAAVDDMLVFEDGSRALVFDLNPDLIGGVLLRETEGLTAGISVHLAHTLFTDGVRFAALCARSRTALAAENLFLRKQLAFYQERKVAPRRFDNVP